jgi:hypothetical protein
MNKSPLPNGRLNRRRFVQRAGLATAALALPFFSPRNVLGANSRLNVAAIGAGGKGAIDIGFCEGENVAALCDVDQNHAAGTFQRFPQAKRFKDFRVMLEQLSDGIDAVTISTPDHTHFHAAALAMKQGLHVYLQKPLTHCQHLRQGRRPPPGGAGAPAAAEIATLPAKGRACLPGPFSVRQAPIETTPAEISARVVLMLMVVSSR